MTTAWDGMHPARPPDDLRARVLAAARVAARPEVGLTRELYRDPLLRWCAATLVVLILANALVVWGGRSRAPRPRVADSGDGLAVPVDTGLTAFEQLRALALES